MSQCSPRTTTIKKRILKKEKRKQATANAGEDVGRKEPLCPVGGMSAGAATVELSVNALKEQFS
jgi:hypothetical protein